MLPITSKLEALRTRGHYDTHQPDFSALVEDFPELSAVVTHKNRHRDARGDDADVGPRGKHPRSHARGAGAGDSSDEEAMDDSRSDSYTTGCAGNAARTWLDFSDPRAATLLSRALLRTDFELSIDVPRGNLCPVVPRSLNYLHFTRRIMEAALATQLAASGYEPDGSALPHAGVTFSHGLDCEQPATRALLVAASALLDAGADSAACHTDPAAYPVAAADANSSSSSSSSSAPAPRFPPLLLDVGTGATAVFLLLARRLYGYGGVGIDVDPRSCLSAAGNAARNTAAPAILTTNPGAPAADSGGPAADPAATAGRAVAIVHSHDRASVLAPVLPQFPAAVPPVPELSQATAPTSAWSVRQAREPTRQAPAEPADGSAEVSAGARVAAVLYPLLRRPFALTVCNPPFFNASAPADVAAAVVAAAEAAASTAVTVDVPDSASSGAADKQYFSVPRNPTREWAATGSELACPGGEVAFVSQMILESAANPLGSQWFTTMLGKKASLAPLLALLHSSEITEVAEAALRQTAEKAAAAAAADGTAEQAAARELIAAFANTPVECTLTATAPAAAPTAAATTTTAAAAAAGGRSDAAENAAVAAARSALGSWRDPARLGPAAAAGIVYALPPRPVEAAPQSRLRARLEPVTRAPPALKVLIVHYAYSQGKQTRWALAWTFDPFFLAALSRAPLVWMELLRGWTGQAAANARFAHIGKPRRR